MSVIHQYCTTNGNEIGAADGPVGSALDRPTQRRGFKPRSLPQST